MFKVPLDTSVSASSALSAVEFSRSISRRNRDDPSADNSQCCGEGDGSCQSTANRFEFLYCSTVIVKDLRMLYKATKYAVKTVFFDIRRCFQITVFELFRGVYKYLSCMKKLILVSLGMSMCTEIVFLMVFVTLFN